MLKNTFCHLPEISVQDERCLWENGCAEWESVPGIKLPLSPRKLKSLNENIEQSFMSLEKRDLYYFADNLNSKYHWRFFPEFRNDTAYLDIETTGMGSYYDHITTIALFDGKKIYTYVYGDNLEDFKKDIQRYKVIVTYNGKCFDVPFIKKTLQAEMNHVHIDLRYLLKSLGYTGGLKGCEKKLGISRGSLEDVDGYFAVLLWQEYIRTKKSSVLDTLLAYNIEDTVNLEKLMVMSYNMKMEETPFNYRLEMPDNVLIPFNADSSVISSIRKRMGFGF